VFHLKTQQISISKSVYLERLVCQHFQAWRLKILADMLLLLQKESMDSVIPQREKEFYKLCEEAIEVGFERSWVEEMRQRVVARDPKLREDIAQRQIDENSKRYDY